MLILRLSKYREWLETAGFARSDDLVIEDRFDTYYWMTMYRVARLDLPEHLHPGVLAARPGQEPMG